ncbi:DUF4333 domain-containing protein [Nocardia pseudobrasiliensis]|uniref:Uncharacterized protein DUF4333 n=1 Tax=Nocardia pseudobrasiliensis TaxID=45979 RepID=A0A370I9D4_9NOCA|nr:DUF4333 domain-containing protein [Nocardia pseudobrasiliensis]RDI67327.1 uncharacterized protein DUF4333 [Nocardia pseudobrasiliensis]
MRRLLLLLPVLIAVGCSSNSVAKVDDKDTQAAIADLFQKSAAEAPASPSCDGALDAKTGATVKCKANDSAGKTWPITAKVTKVDGGKATVEAAFDDHVVAVDDAKAKISRMYRQIADGEVTKVDCQGLQKMEANSSRKCTVTEASGKTVPVTFVVSAVKDDQYSFSVGLSS